jgi:hypothetical protein
MSTMLRRPKEMTTASTLASGSGRCSASAATNGTGLAPRRAVSRLRPVRSMPSEKSVARQRAPVRASSTVETPVPAATSRTVSPGPTARAARVARRQRTSWAKDRTVLVRS